MITDQLNVERYKEPYLEAVSRLIEIPSVTSSPLLQKPFGEAIDQCLNKALGICETLGFKVFKDPEGYYGYAEIGGSDPDGELLGILGHLDIVPPGELGAWTTPPFVPSLRNGRLYGRGAQDDKGPTLAVVFAIKALVDAGYVFRHRVRVIFGTDEENLWRCMERYSAKESIPSAGFAPDSGFPLTYAEKTLIQGWLAGPGSEELSVDIGGTLNAVPGLACYRGGYRERLIDALNELGFDFACEEDEIQVYGKAAHAASSDTKGVNAITRLCIALKKVGVDHPAVEFIAEQVGEDANAQQLFGPLHDESGRLTCNIGALIINEEESKVGIDLRVPVSVDKEQIDGDLKEVCGEYGLTYSEYSCKPSLFVPVVSDLVGCLMGAYQSITGDKDAAPIASGGATYARAFPNCVAFGAILPGREKVEHMSDEFLIIEDMMLAIQIYAEALVRMDGIDKF